MDAGKNSQELISLTQQESEALLENNQEKFDQSIWGFAENVSNMALELRTITQQFKI